MSDQRARELERRWRESGTWADRLAVLHAERRAGALNADELRLLAAVDDGLALEKLTLLAYFCVPAAGRLLGDELVALASYAGDMGAVRVVLGDPTDRNDLREWVLGLGCWHKAAWPILLAAIRLASEASGDDETRGFVGLFDVRRPELGNEVVLLALLEATQSTGPLGQVLARHASALVDLVLE